MKIDRRKVYNKYNGHCAYCGCKIDFNKMQVDHYWPQVLSHLKPKLDKDTFDNLMPSCAKCNNHKHGMRPEVWREELGKQVVRLQKNAQFDRALRFGQIKIIESPILFYFEKCIWRKKTISPEGIQCPVCGYYCLGNGGIGCINKPELNR